MTETDLIRLVSLSALLIWLLPRVLRLPLRIIRLSQGLALGLIGLGILAGVIWGMASGSG